MVNSYFFHWYAPDCLFGATIHHNKSYFDSASAKTDGDSSSSDVSKGQYIDLRGSDGKQTTYLVQEDMKDVFLYSCNIDSSTIPIFDVLPGNPDVAYKKVFTTTIPSQGVNPTANVFYIPVLKAGTTISNYTSYGTYGIYIFKANDSNKGQNVTSIKLSGQSAYSVKSNLKDVFFVSFSYLGSGNPPTFETLSGDPIVAFKRLFHDNYASVFYIPELRAGTVIKDLGNSYLVY